MKIAYVAGPYRAEDWERKLSNIAAASDVARRLWAAGFAVICPHKNSGGFDGYAPETVFGAGYLEILESCDFVVLVPGWQRSSGTVEERECALRRGLRVYEGVEAAIEGEARA